MIESDFMAIEMNKSSCSWFSTYGIVPHLIQLSGSKSILEVGVAYGYHAEFILNSLPHISYTGVDPYLAGYDPHDIFCQDVQRLMGEVDQQVAMDRLYAVVEYKLNKYDSRAKLMRKKSEEGAISLPNHSVDLIYIDGDHTYEGVMKDLNSWWDKVNHQSGVICGDDFSWLGVKKACDDFFNSKNLQYSLIKKNGYEHIPVWYYDFSQRIK